MQGSVNVPITMARPVYTIKRYRDDCYKVVKFKTGDSDFLHFKDDEVHENTEKLDNSLSRARSRIFELAACNDWQWFFTGTLDSSKFSRNDLNKFRSVFAQWIRDLRKKYHSRIEYMIVPEFHKKGGVHVHGFISGVPDSFLVSLDDYGCDHPLPVRLLGHDYYTWTDYMKKFGFNSLSRIHNPIGCAFYICKYMSKNLCQRKSELGGHLFFPSQGLKSAVRIGDYYAESNMLDKYLSADFEFCSTGYITPRLGADGNYMQIEDDLYDFLGCLGDDDRCLVMDSFSYDRDAVKADAAELEAYEQLVLCLG